MPNENNQSKTGCLKRFARDVLVAIVAGVCLSPLAYILSNWSAILAYAPNIAVGIMFLGICFPALGGIYIDVISRRKREPKVTQIVFFSQMMLTFLAFYNAGFIEFNKHSQQISILEKQLGVLEVSVLEGQLDALMDKASPTDKASPSVQMKANAVSKSAEELKRKRDEEIDDKQVSLMLYNIASIINLIVVVVCLFFDGRALRSLRVENPSAAARPNLERSEAGE